MSALSPSSSKQGMPRKVRLTDKIRNFFNLGPRQDLDDVLLGPRPSAERFEHLMEPVGANHNNVQIQQAKLEAAERSTTSTSIRSLPEPGKQSRSPTDGSNDSTLPVGPVSQTPDKDAILKHLVVKLKDGTVEQRCVAVEQLFNLTNESEKARQKVSEMGVVEPLVELLKTGTDSGKMFAAYTLSSLTSIDVSCDSMKALGAVPALVEVLQQCPMLNSKKGAMRALGRLARSDDVAYEIVRCGGLPAILQLLSTPDNSLVRRCLIALYFIGADKDGMQQEIANAGAISMLLQLCRSENSVIQAEAVDVVKVLSRNLSCGLHILELHGLEILADVAMNGLSERSQKSATRALQRLYDIPELKEQLLKSGADEVIENDQEGDEVQQLVTVVTRGDDWARVRAAAAVENISALDPTSSRDLAAYGMVEPLVELLHNGTAEGRASAARALARMAEEQSVSDRVVGAGAAPLLLAALTSLPSQGQQAALDALSVLATNPHGVASITDASAVGVLLHVATTSSNDVVVMEALQLLHKLQIAQPSICQQVISEGGVSLLVRRCWRGSPSARCSAAAVLCQLAAQPDCQVQLLGGGAIPLLIAMQWSPDPNVQVPSCDALQHLLASPELHPAIVAEHVLQESVSQLLSEVQETVEVTAAMEEVLRMVPRSCFLPQHMASDAFMDVPIPLPELGVSMTAASLEVAILESLMLHQSCTVLDVGCGSGFSSCMAAYLVEHGGYVLGVDVNSHVVSYAECQAEHLFVSRALTADPPQFKCTDIFSLIQTEGLRFDRIMVGCMCPEALLHALHVLLAPKGRMVACCEGSLLVVTQELGVSGASVLQRNITCDPVALPAHLSPPQQPIPSSATPHYGKPNSIHGSQPMPHCLSSSPSDIVAIPATTAQERMSPQHLQQQSNIDSSQHQLNQQASSLHQQEHYQQQEQPVAASSSQQPHSSVRERNNPSNGGQAGFPATPSAAAASQALDAVIDPPSAHTLNADAGQGHAEVTSPATSGSMYHQALKDRIESHMQASPSNGTGVAASGTSSSKQTPSSARRRSSPQPRVAPSRVSQSDSPAREAKGNNRQGGVERGKHFGGMRGSAGEKIGINEVAAGSGKAPGGGRGRAEHSAKANIQLDGKAEVGVSVVHANGGASDKEKKLGNRHTQDDVEDALAQVNVNLETLKDRFLKVSDVQICRNAEGKKCRLGEGGFGVVYKAIMYGIDEVAVKLVKNDNPSHKDKELFYKEVAILSKLHHRNIVQFYGACLEPGHMFFVTELMKGGDLYSALRNHPETMRWDRLGKKVALDVALGINYLHSQKPPMMHRDLKSPNVLLSEEGVAKIADVGMVRSQVKDLVTAQPVMTPLWAAPEVMRRERASIKADIWSYGILIWELVSGEDITEYQPLAITKQMGVSSNSKDKSSSGTKTIELPIKSPMVARQLFHACTQMQPENRPTAQQLVEWLRNDRGD